MLIDYQPAQLAAVRSMDHELLLKNAVSTVRTIKTFGVPVVHSTVNVASGRGKPTLAELAVLLEDDKPDGMSSATGRSCCDTAEPGPKLPLIVDASAPSPPRLHLRGN